MAAEYYWGTGRRKTSVARVRICRGTGKFLVNDRLPKEYFPSELQVNKALTAAKTLGNQDQWDVFANVNGGGFAGQCDAIRLGLARALQGTLPSENRVLRQTGLLTRDSRKKERKHYGRRGARRGFQFSKR